MRQGAIQQYLSYNYNMEERFWSKVLIKEPDECWIWTAFIDRHGYGRFYVDGEMMQTHRIAYTLTHGPIPPGMEVCHKCDNPQCCNPNHLFLGTHADNMLDMRQKKRARTLATKVKVTRTLKKQIREAYENEDTTIASLAERFGVHITTVATLLRK